MANDRPDRPARDRGRTRAATATRAEIDAFLSRVKELAPTTQPGRRGRLIFALDATMSRQPIWDTACRLQADMFREAAAIGGVDLQLGFFRGPRGGPRPRRGCRGGGLRPPMCLAR